MNTNLDNLNDAQLSEVFAVEVAGWTELVKCTCGVHLRGAPPQGGSKHVPDFSTSADAVLPFLVQKLAEIKFHDDGVSVSLWGERPWASHFFQTEFLQGETPNGWVNRKPKPQDMARASCIALIKSKRAEK